MPRRKAAEKRVTLPDPLYGSERLSKFINVVMRAGKKSLAEQIVYKALDLVQSRVKKDKGDHHNAAAEGDAAKRSAKKTTTVAKKVPVTGDQETLEILDKALNNIRPTVEVKSRRVGGATYQVPIEVSLERGLALAMRWLVDAAKGRGEKTMVERLAAEIRDCLEGRGNAMKKRDDMHRMAKANQAFAHYRW